MPARAHYEHILTEAGEQYHVLPLHGGASLLVTRRGARVLGIFPAPDAANLLWTNQAAFESTAAFRAFVASGNWNLGGERIWIAPEIQYNVRDRNDFWGTLHIPPQMDPGDYKLSPAVLEDGRSIINISTIIEMRTYNLVEDDGVYLFFERFVAPAPDPLRHWQNHADLLHGVTYSGYQQDLFLDAENSRTVSEAWNLVQVNAGGQLLIPCLPFIEASDYFGAVPDEARQIQSGDVPHIRLTLTGKQQYKIGYKSLCMTGRMGYFHTLPDGRAYLLIRSFFNNPSNLYAEEPPHLPGVNGHSVHVYNDGGEFGGANSFGEMEVTGKTVRGGTRIMLDDAARDQFVMWAYVGAPEKIRQIAYLLLGVRL
jgi:hypothetical protein